MAGRGREPWGAAPVAFMVVATLLWGATFVVIRDTVVRVDPVALVFTRFAIAGPALLAAAVLARRPFTRAAWAGVRAARKSSPARAVSCSSMVSSGLPMAGQSFR